MPETRQVVDTYITASYEASKLITNRYSTSFGLSIRLFEPALRPHIYAIYGFVRIADEIVDTYTGSDRLEVLNELESHAKHALKTGYSTNPIVQAFVTTARMYNIGSSLITPFFKSMRMDITPKPFDQKRYEAYIYGSAEVVGLMCLKVFTADEKIYQKLEKGASHLGAAYQKVNFLRDIAADADDLGRWYFPISSFKAFDEKAKAVIIRDIEKDFKAASTAIAQLPESSRKAVELSYQYYNQLLKRLKLTPASKLLTTRIRINNLQKTALLMQVSLGKKHA